MQPVIETEPIVETRGDDWIWPFTFTDENDTAIDLTGCTFDGAVIKWSDGALAVDSASGRLSIDAAAGGVTVTVARADNTQVPDGQRARCVLPITDTLNHKSTLLIIPVQVVVP
jgi:hypothetical protein